MKIRTLVAAAVLASTPLLVAAPQADATTKPRHFKNCTAMNKVYKHGVGKKGAKDHTRSGARKVRTFKVDTALYKANRGSDRDHDGIACEKL
ncbi:excalibur calcium-binding domain-containing protein [Microlunatus soli]|uniref:Excalibur calcium-binding domain-containing protein n=1 Tax=Microlunatus soli TaxID=630515 RepID=A0A1H1TTF8_9ACTN|nr:excalibur calcium-binding domain-containing protein [Microlunatus soli]SDS62889.1 Excalibur calcium-binding domain-containing protein [Microlunatus soli]